MSASTCRMIIGWPGVRSERYVYVNAGTSPHVVAGPDSSSVTSAVFFMKSTDAAPYAAARRFSRVTLSTIECTAPPSRIAQFFQYPGRSLGRDVSVQSFGAAKFRRTFPPGADL